ncbi:MAG: hypothetical protein GF409_01950 [Candidatus Omnitrophica bacterium]|nr:hypothetical protein [Candidatus Omnitrophota bacterium]
MKTIIVISIIISFSCVLNFAVIAEEADNPVTNVISGSVKTVGKAAEGTAKTVASPVEAMGKSMQGKETPDKIITSPVEKGGETVYDATRDTGKTVTGQKVE